MANGVSILIRSWSPNLYLPCTPPTRTAPLLENSQTISSEPPDMRHLPTILEFPHPTIANSNAAEAIILKLDFERQKQTRMGLRLGFCSECFLRARKKVGTYFFFDSRFGSFDSFVSRLESPGRYSSCSAAAKAFSRPTMSSPGRSVSKDSTSLRSCSSE